MLAESMKAVSERCRDMKGHLPKSLQSPPRPLETVLKRPKTSAAILLGLAVAVGIGYFVGPELVRYLKMRRM